LITIDASVLVAAGAPDDPACVDAAAFIDAALTNGLAIHQPTLTLVEVGAAIARRTGDGGLASEAGANVARALRRTGPGRQGGSASKGRAKGRSTHRDRLVAH
jgi:predicted nucleic acid-binding protein